MFAECACLYRCAEEEEGIKVGRVFVLSIPPASASNSKMKMPIMRKKREAGAMM
jgi:hypothetical protein